jgi:hypothetical protein
VEAHVGPCCLFCVGVSWPCEAIQGARIVRAMLAVERDATELIDPARMLEAGAAALEGDGR